MSRRSLEPSGSLCGLRTGHGRLELTKFHTPTAVGAEPNAPANTLGIRRIMFAVEDIEDVLARLHAHGAELVGELEQYEDSYRLCHVRGPEGNHRRAGRAAQLKRSKQVTTPTTTPDTRLPNIIGSLDDPTAGRVWVDGRQVNRMSEQERLSLWRDTLAFIFQYFGLVTMLSAAENVGVPPRIAGRRGGRRGPPGVTGVTGSRGHGDAVDTS